MIHNTDKAISALSKLEVFNGLVDEEFQILLRACNAITVHNGRAVITEGEWGSSIFVLLSGRMEITLRSKGVVHHLEPGEVLGEMALVSQLPRTASAKADGDCVLLEIEIRRLRIIFDDHPAIGYTIMSNIANILAKRLSDTNKKLLHGFGG